MKGILFSIFGIVFAVTAANGADVDWRPLADNGKGFPKPVICETFLEAFGSTATEFQKFKSNPDDVSRLANGLSEETQARIREISRVTDLPNSEHFYFIIYGKDPIGHSISRLFNFIIRDSADYNKKKVSNWILGWEPLFIKDLNAIQRMAKGNEEPEASYSFEGILGYSNEAVLEDPKSRLAQAYRRAFLPTTIKRLLGEKTQKLEIKMLAFRNRKKTPVLIIRLSTALTDK